MAFDLQAAIEAQKAKTGGPATKSFDLAGAIANKKAGVASPTPVKPRIPSPLLKTEPGLQAAMKITGLESEAQRLLKEKGENPDQIFSGGTFSDIFDTLNALSYGNVGFIKGVGYKEGIKTRESFTKGSQLADPGLFRFLVGLALDIAVDPLTYSPVAPASIVSKVGKIPGVAKAASKVADVAQSSWIGQQIGTRLVYRFGQDPVYRKMDELRIKNIGVSNENSMNLVKPIAALNKEAQQRIAEARKAGNLDNLDDDLKALAEPAFAELDKLGKEAVEAGLLSAEKYEENVGSYLARFYRSKELGPASQALKGLFPAKPQRIDLSRFKSRQDIPEEIRMAMGEILEAGYPTAKALVQLRGAIENAKFFKQVAETFAIKDTKSLPGNTAVYRGGQPLDKAKLTEKGVSVTDNPRIAESFTREWKGPKPPVVENYFISPTAKIATFEDIPKKFLGKKDESGLYQNLTDEQDTAIAKWAKENGFDGVDMRKVDVDEIRIVNPDVLISKPLRTDGFVELPKTDRLGPLSGKAVPAPIADSINEIVRTKTDSERIKAAIVGGFKFGKVVLNLPTHARNMASNLMLNHWEGLNPLKPSGFKAYTVAAKEMATAGPLYREAKQAGLGLDSFAAAEINSFIQDPQVKKLADKLGSGVMKFFDGAANLYQKEEEYAKLAQYIFQRTENKLPPEEAWKIAERATFNYAQVTPFIRNLRTALWGFPFITFTYKVTPQVAKTLYKTPTRISNIGKIKEGIENQTNQGERKAERETEPDYIRDGFYVKLPFKDKEGRSAYFDLTYILPFGDLVSGQFFEGNIARETGISEGLPRSAARKSPAANLVAELMTNQDFFGNKIYLPSDSWEKVGADIFRHISKTYLPPILADQIPGGYRADGTHKPGTVEGFVKRKRGTEEGGAETRSLMQEILKHVGIKISPIDLATQSLRSERERIKAIQTLLKDQGIISSFEIPFSPKD